MFVYCLSHDFGRFFTKLMNIILAVYSDTDLVLAKNIATGS